LEYTLHNKIILIFQSTCTTYTQNTTEKKITPFPKKFFPETVIMENQEDGYTDGNVNTTQLNSIRKKAMTF